MKVLFAVYDENDYLINTGFSLAEVGVAWHNSWFWQHRNKKVKLYRIPLESQDDVFKQEDDLFIREFENEIYTNDEIAKQQGVSVRTIYRNKAKLKRLGATK